MLKIIRSPDCGHSPKNQFLEDLAIARVTNDSTILARLLSDNVAWTIIGQPPIEGKGPVLEAIKDRQDRGVMELKILHVTQHGRIGAVNGQLKLRGGTTVDFCDVCEFANTKGTSVAAVASYVIRSE